MPVLMIALIALAVFGVIGILLFTAAMLESKAENSHEHDQVSAGNAVAVKH